MNGFRRVGLDYRFEPEGMPLVLLFQRVRDKGDEVSAQVVVCNQHDQPYVTRHVNLMAGPTRGAIGELIKELAEIDGHDDKAWRLLMREATENVIRAHRMGRPFLSTEGITERPPPPTWLCEGLLLKDKPNCWLGASSTGKSTLAKAMCAYYASGFRFCDRVMEQGTPLYLDWEDDHASFTRVTYDVCQNLGVPMPRMLWRDMHGYRMRDQLDSLAQAIDREHVGLMVLDAVAAAGGSTGEHMSWEAIALELEECLGALPPVTVLALDHVTGAEHRQGSKFGYVPIKARGAERKLEYLRNQWSLVTDDTAAELGRHVVNWFHTKNSVGLKERPFATEILHYDSEISIVLRPMEVVMAPENMSETDRLLLDLQTTSGRTARELALEVDGKEPSRSRVETVRKLLERAIERGRASKDGGHPPRYFAVSADSGQLIPFPGTSA